MRTELINDVEVAFSPDKDKVMRNVLLRFSDLGDQKLLQAALYYYGGIKRWTDKVVRIAVDNVDKWAVVECDFTRGRSSDPLGFNKNSDYHAIHDLIEYVHNGVMTKGATNIGPSGYRLKEVIVGFDETTDELPWENLEWVYL